MNNNLKIVLSGILFFQTALYPMEYCNFDEMNGSVSEFHPKFDIAVRSHFGRRNNQEDTFVIGPDVMGVFDGHGGKDISKYAAININKFYKRERNEGQDVPTALSLALASIEKYASGSQHVGSTAIVMAVDEQEMAHVAWMGDSFGIIFDKTEQGYIKRCRTASHLPSREDEAKRIFDKGGRIGYKLHSEITEKTTLNDCTYVGKIEDLPDNFFTHSSLYAARIQNGNQIGSIMMSRALGDRNYKRKGKEVLSAEPEFLEAQKLTEASLILLASDGLSDSFNDEEIEKELNAIVLYDDKKLQEECENTFHGNSEENNERLSNIARLLIDKALRKYMQDNTTLMLLQLKKKE